MKFGDWQALSRWLDGRGMFHMELGLSRMEKALGELGLQKPPFRVCQVLGTNGKGSVSVFLSALCGEAGLKTGLYTSPHFLSPMERIHVDGRMLPENEWLELADILASACSAWQDLTYFEFITLLALLAFQRAGVEIAILEAGLGGRNDATSPIDMQWQCFTAIALDHRAVIGPGIRDIAKDKAAAIKEGSAVFSSPQYPEVAQVLEKEAARRHCRLEFCGAYPLPVRARLGGPHQSYNMGLALACAKAIWAETGMTPLDCARIDAALANAFLPGRRQEIPACSGHPALLLDGGHNPHAIKGLVENMGDAPDAVLFACMKDKDWRPTLGMLARAWPDALFILPSLAMERAEDNAVLAQWLNERWPRRALTVSGENAVEKALALAREKAGEGLCLVTGSFFLLAEIYRFFPEYLLDDPLKKIT